MLDVHPPEHTPHSWRDFFIHIATIVVGLIIAVCLEQTVEWIHHRYEIRELREALKQERDENRKRFAINVALYRLENAELQNTIGVLLFMQQHPGIPEEKLPAALRSGYRYVSGVESVWKAAQQSQVLGLLPREEEEQDADFYRALEQMDAATQALIPTTINATGYGIVDTDLYHMTPAQLSEVIQATQKAIQLTSVWGISLVNLNLRFPDFKPALTVADVFSNHSLLRSPSEQKKLAPIEAITDAKLAPFIAAVNAAKKSAEAAPESHR